MNRASTLVLALAAAFSIGCSRHERPVAALDVNLYLHPEAANADDLILETAIQKRLAANEATRSATIHVRVIDRTVFLSGAVDSVKAKEEAARVAESTEITLNGEPIKPSLPVRNSITTDSE
ncbi:MAG TPA: BON domain-containing protein [Terriglobia bacterium]|nr:BON domain-containing protein [Terriglobia bacterium]